MQEVYIPFACLALTEPDSYYSKEILSFAVNIMTMILITHKRHKILQCLYDVVTFHLSSYNWDNHDKVYLTCSEGKEDSRKQLIPSTILDEKEPYVYLIGTLR